MNAARIDSKGRISLPREIHEALGSTAGDTLFFNINAVNHTVEIAKAINPFDILAADAWAEFKRGETMDLRDFAEEMEIDLDER